MLLNKLGYNRQGRAGSEVKYWTEVATLGKAIWADLWQKNIPLPQAIALESATTHDPTTTLCDPCRDLQRLGACRVYLAVRFYFRDRPLVLTRSRADSAVNFMKHKVAGMSGTLSKFVSVRETDGECNADARECMFV